jgi:hypothetical protein
VTSALAPSAPSPAPVSSGRSRPRPAPPAQAPAHPPHQIAGQHLLLLYSLLAALALALALARLASGPWFHVYNPRELGLIDGWPVSWESTYYTDHLPTFASDARPGFGISPVHYRTLLPLFLAAQLYAWSGAAFWSFAAVDLLFWGLAGIAGLHLALRLGATPLAAALAGLLTVASPVLASHMWRHDLHVADFAGLPIALWAAVVLVDEPRPPLQLSGALAVLLLLLSLSYQYQWLVAPLAFVLCATQPRIGWRRGALVMLGAIALYAVLTAASQALFRVAVGDPTTWTGAVVAPSRAILGPLGAARTPAQAYSAVAALLPDLEQIAAVWRAYHPLVLGAGLGGALLLGRRMLLLLGTGMLIALGAHLVYPAPWTAALCYPLVAVGAGAACAAAGEGAGRVLPRWPWAGAAAALALALVCAAVTNLDLVGLPAFALDWWRSYTHMSSRF